VVAAPAKLTVVALLLIRSKEVDPVVREVEISGEVPKTRRPVPVSSVTELAILAEEILVTKLLELSVATSLLAVRPPKVTVPEEDRPDRPVSVPVAVKLPLAAMVNLVVPEAEAVKRSPRPWLSTIKEA